MLFSSITFIFIFLPVVFLFLFFSDRKYHNFILLAASILFYLFGDLEYLYILFAVILISYIGGILIAGSTKYKKVFLFLTVISDISFLIYFKYFNFIVKNLSFLNLHNGNFMKIALPLGISFYTFQSLSYIIDVYRGKVKAQKNLYKLCLYICLFPQLVAGPIIKYHDIEADINSREISFDMVQLGVKRFIIGLSKKMLVANTLGLIADKIFAQSPAVLPHYVTWLGAFSYTFQIFFDFSGYSDMAIGLGMIFGFKFMENFNYPYISKSITEFWRRWHISLSTWFKEYVYIPLGGSKDNIVKTVRNLIIVFLLTGIWHGAAWTFVLWGVWHGVFIIFEKIIDFKKAGEKYNKAWHAVLKHIYCIAVFLTGWVIFRSESVSYAFGYLANMFGFLRINSNDIIYDIGYYIDVYEIIVIIAAIICSTPVFRNILTTNNTIKRICLNVWLLILFIISSAAIAIDTYNPFIYFRF